MTDNERNSVESDGEIFSVNYFDPTDESSWHFGDVKREEVMQLLENEQDGVFCVRESSTQHGNLVLSIKESGNGKDHPISHYLINVTRNGDNSPISFGLGDQIFLSMAQLLKYYMGHYLESTFLIRPARRVYTKMIARFDFVAQEEGDLSFKTNEILYVAQRKSEASWWMARNVLGQSGLIPSNYLEECSNNDDVSSRNSFTSVAENITDNSRGSQNSDDSTVPVLQLKPLPAFARVKMARVPNAYDKTALRLEINDRVKVLKTDPSGTWEGELNGKIGVFPFTYVEWEEET